VKLRIRCSSISSQHRTVRRLSVRSALDALLRLRRATRARDGSTRATASILNELGRSVCNIWLLTGWPVAVPAPTDGRRTIGGEKRRVRSCTSANFSLSDSTRSYDHVGQPTPRIRGDGRRVAGAEEGRRNDLPPKGRSSCQWALRLRFVCGMPAAILMNVAQLGPRSGHASAYCCNSLHRRDGGGIRLQNAFNGRRHDLNDTICASSYVDHVDHVDVGMQSIVAAKSRIADRSSYHCST